MRIIFCIMAGIFLSVAGWANVGIKPAGRPDIFVSDYENVLGTSMQLKISAANEIQSALAESIVLREISRMSAILSGYDELSEFSRWQKTQGIAVHVSKDLFEVLKLFDVWREKTGGALDASAEQIGRLWKNAATNNALPTSSEIEKAVSEVKRKHWVLDARNQTATHVSDAPLMLNSFTKSYIISHAADIAMVEAGLQGIIVNIGGDLVIRGNMREAVLISDPRYNAENDHPLDELQIEKKAVATSGNYRRGEMIAGNWYSHIVDPRTGFPADEIISATVVSSNAVEAGALATAFNVMSPTESVKLANSIPGVDYLIITKNNEKIKSVGWDALTMKKELKGKTSAKSITAPDDEFELSINLEINLVKEGFAKRPYLAVWIEDENHASIRTVTVWQGNTRYLPELKSWYMKNRGVYNEDQQFNKSVTSATRSAGKYTVKWDGKDDHGNTVKPGKYTLKIEVAREHGTYQLMRQEIDWDSSPKMMSLPGNVEIAGVSLDYHKKKSTN